MSDQQQLVDAASSVIASKSTTLTSSATTVGSGFIALISQHDWITIITTCTTVGGFCIAVISVWSNWRFKKREELRAEERHKLEIQKLLKESKELDDGK